MPDSGSNGYISVAADGTVVTPTNLTPAGVIAAGDLATHADLDTLSTTYDLPDVAHQADLDTLTTYIDARDGDRVLGANLEILGPFSVPLVVAGANLTYHYADFDLYTSGLATWAAFIFVGWWVGNGHVAMSNAQDGGPGVTRLWFTSLSPGLQSIDGHWDFFAIGNP